MRQMLGYLPNDNTRAQLIELLELGAQVDLICAVLEYTKARAPRPSWAYAYKVAKVHVKQGNVSAESFNASVRDFWSNKTTKASYVPGFFNVKCPYDQPAPKRVLAQQYSQRDYTAPEYANIDYPSMSAEDMAILSSL